MGDKAFLQRFWERFIWRSEKRGLLGNPNIPLNASFVDAFMDGDDEGVTSRSSLNIPGFYRGLRIRSGIPASVQWNVMEKTPDGMRPAENSPAQRVLKYPNEAMTSFVFREMLQLYTDIFGNGFAEIVRNGRGEPVELWPLHPNNVEVLVDNRKLAYRYTEKGISKIILPSEMIHIKNFSLDGFYGLGLIDVAKKVLGYNIEGQRQASNYISKNGVPPAILKYKGMGRLGNDQKKENKEAWQRARKEGGIAVLNSDYDFQSVIVPPDQMQFIESRHLGTLDIARFVEIEPHLLFDLRNGVTYASIEQQNLNLLQFTLRGIIKRKEEELDRKLLMYSELKTGNFGVRYNMNSLLRGDSQSRSELYRALWSLGAMNSETIAEYEGLPRPSGGDTYWVQQGFAPADKWSENDFKNNNVSKNGQNGKAHLHNGAAG